MASAIVVGRNVEHVCGFIYHGKDPKKNPCANHSSACESKVRPVQMCFSSHRCDICGLCTEHCVGHLGVKGWSDSRAYQAQV